jgi:hypothetical protein
MKLNSEENEMKLLNFCDSLFLLSRAPYAVAWFIKMSCIVNGAPWFPYAAPCFVAQP